MQLSKPCSYKRKIQILTGTWINLNIKYANLTLNNTTIEQSNFYKCSIFLGSNVVMRDCHLFDCSHIRFKGNNNKVVNCIVHDYYKEILKMLHKEGKITDEDYLVKML